MPRPQWTMDAGRGEYYYWDHDENCYVYQNGERIYASQSPNNQPVLGDVEIGSAEPIMEPQALRSGIGACKKVRETPGGCERLDPRYKKHYPGREFYKVGKVFKVLWPEPAGNPASGMTFATGSYEEQFYNKTRWFVVIREGRDCCTCLPIQAYNGRGVDKLGVIKRDHSVAYTENSPPVPAQDDPYGEMLPAIPIRPKSPAESRISPMARINYAKPYTVEHNVKSFHIGDVPQEWLQTLHQNFASVFQSPETGYRAPALDTSDCGSAGNLQTSHDNHERPQSDAYEFSFSETQAQEFRQDPAMDEIAGPGGFRLFDDASDDDEKTLSKRMSKSSKWIERFKKMYELIAVDEDSKDRVKIAILDTGVDLEHQDFNKDRIKDVRTWVNGANGKKDRNFGDRCGHGTHIAGLLSIVAPEADIYVARVADSKKLREPGHVAEAIRYAVLQWKVDIITMSFGFNTRARSIELAVDDVNTRCLVFAAASNDGGNHERTYPAEFQSVICVHSSSSEGNPSSFTPNRRKNSDNFCTLGEAIESAWPGPPGGCNLKIRSGNSFATPIAVGIAAFVLEYVRQHIDNEEILRILKKSEGMKKVFYLMETDRQGYQYLAPWKLFDLEKESVKYRILDALR